MIWSRWPAQLPFCEPATWFTGQQLDQLGFGPVAGLSGTLLRGVSDNHRKEKGAS
jgi:hypothetical protein